MSFDRIPVLGAPNYGPMKGYEGCVFHTPENNDPSVEAAVATARWQATYDNKSGGSYHGILGHDAARGPMSKPEAWVLVQTVPFNRIAGSISTRRDTIWRPDRFPRLKEYLSPAAYADPNAYLHALALGGKAAWWKSKLSTAAGRAEVRGALVASAVWVRRLEVEYDYDSFLNQHRFWQTNRSDADGGITTLDIQLQELVLDEYMLRFFPQQAPVEETSFTQAELDAAVAAAVSPLNATITRLRKRITEKNEAIATARESLVIAEDTLMLAEDI